MMSVEDVISIHKILIDRFGGSPGIRDKGALEAAINRSYATFDGKELYKSIEEKAAATIESLLINHPFIDGNKRIGYTLMRLMLLNEKKDIEANEQDKYEFVINIASGRIKYEEVLKWIQKRIK